MSALDRAWESHRRDCHHFEYFATNGTRLFEVDSLQNGLRNIGAGGQQSR